jgi:hypothetical protein
VNKTGSGIGTDAQGRGKSFMWEAFKINANDLSPPHMMFQMLNDLKYHPFSLEFQPVFFFICADKIQLSSRKSLGTLGEPRV